MNWKFSQKGHYVYDKESFKDGMGYVYAAKLYVMPKTFLLKIGSTTMPAQRLVNLGANLKICAISKPHYNFFENEEILHKYYEKARVPCRPYVFNKDIRPELFTISMKYFFETMPELQFETNLQNCLKHEYAGGNAYFYTRKKSANSLAKTIKHS